jgi:hypothetical protein
MCQVPLLLSSGFGRVTMLEPYRTWVMIIRKRMRVDLRQSAARSLPPCLVAYFLSRFNSLFAIRHSLFFPARP